MLHNFFNRTNAPELMVIEKKNKVVKWKIPYDW
jgi:hypothetical protein